MMAAIRCHAKVKPQPPKKGPPQGAKLALDPLASSGNPPHCKPVWPNGVSNPHMSMPRLAMRCLMLLLVQALRQCGKSYPLSAYSLSGRLRGPPLPRRMTGTASSKGASIAMQTTTSVQPTLPSIASSKKRLQVDIPDEARRKIRIWLAANNAPLGVQRDSNDNWISNSSILEEAGSDLLLEHGCPQPDLTDVGYGPSADKLNG